MLHKKLVEEIAKHGGFMNSLKKAFRIYQESGVEGVSYVLRKKKNEILGKGINKANFFSYRGNYLSQLDASASNYPSTHIKRRKKKLDLKYDPVKIIAFYLPQFHPFPENNEWWGQGFTEWTNVSKAIPHFLDHYQPRLPADFGFYDLRTPGIQKEQVELAKQYGIYGFCYYYYWFSGKRLMELPLKQLIDNKDMKHSFCICWANENWTRRWDGREQAVLISQEYLPDDDIKFIKDIESILKDSRYIRIDGRPLLIVYTVFELSDPKRTTDIWRQYCQECGIGEVYLAAVLRFKGMDPIKLGFDGIIEFPPHAMEWRSIRDKQKILYPQYQGDIYDYRQLVKEMQNRVKTEQNHFPVFHGAMPSWDNTARRPDGKGNVFVNSSPEEYNKWLTSICEHTEEKHGDNEKIVFINAWNEWAEGAYLEPDRKYGYAYIEEIARVLERIDGKKYIIEKEKNFTNFGKDANIAVILHLFYADLWSGISNHLSRIPEKFDLYISIPPCFDWRIIDQIIIEYPEVKLRVHENRGRDIAPFLNILNEISDLNLNYTALCKIHSKKSFHLQNGKGWKKEDGNTWRNNLFEDLLKDSDHIKSIIKSFETDPRLGMVGPASSKMNYSEAIGSNQVMVSKLMQELGYRHFQDFSFFAGTMFWVRTEALAPIIRMKISSGLFPEEQGQIDGTLAHAIERIFPVIVEKAGYKVADTNRFII